MSRANITYYRLAERRRARLAAIGWTLANIALVAVLVAFVVACNVAGLPL